MMVPLMSRLQPNLKQDFIINDLGLLPDTVGTVCVETDAPTSGRWAGGITVYKPDTRNGPVAFGTAFDFAIYYPFEVPHFGTLTVPLNTFHLGVDPTSTWWAPGLRRAYRSRRWR